MAETDVGSKRALKLLDGLRRTDVWQAIFSGVLTLFTGLQIYFLVAANKVATDAANAAKSAVELADRTASLQLRPYLVARVTLDEIKESPISNGEFDVHFSYRIKNYGQTPAYNVNVAFVEKEGPFPFNDSYEYGPDTDADGSITIMPQEEYRVKRGHTYLEESLQRMREGKQVFGTIFQVAYRDEFGHVWRIKGMRQTGGYIAFEVGEEMAMPHELNFAEGIDPPWQDMGL